MHGRRARSAAPPPPFNPSEAGATLGAYTSKGDNAKNNQYTLSPDRMFAYDLNGSMTLRADLRQGDFDGNWETKVEDLLSFLTAFRDQDPAADWDGNGEVEVADQLAFLADFGAYGSTSRAHDHFVYDHANRLVGVSRGVGPADTGSTVATAGFVLDALGRRAVETIEADWDDDGTLDPARTVQFVYGGQAGWQALAEYADATASGSLQATHVWGPYIDEAIQVARHAVPGSGVGPQILYYHQDDMATVYAITDETGQVLERYEYGDYGLPKVLAPDGTTVRTYSLVANRIGFTGRWWYPELDLADYRNRWMEPRIGRFIQRDPLGYVDGMNMYTYCGDRPLLAMDPLGLAYAWCKLQSQRCTSSKTVWWGLVRIKVCLQRTCKWRCYCDINRGTTCFKIPCRNKKCPKDHGVEEKHRFGPDPTKPLGAAPLCSDKSYEIIAHGVCS